MDNTPTYAASKGVSMGGPGPFADIGKKAKSLLFSDYFYDQKIVFASKTDSGLKFNTTSVRKGEEVSSDVKTELRLGQVDTEIKVDTKNKIHVKAELGEAAPGLKVALSGILPDPKSTKLELKYKQDAFYGTASAGVVAQPTVESTIAFGAHGWVAGGEVGYDTATNMTTKYSLGMQYAEGDYAAALLWTDKGETLKASFYQKIDFKTAFAAELAHKLNKKDTSLSAGASYRIDDVTDSKFRVNNRGIVAGLIEHEFQKKSTITFSAEVDSKALEKSSKVGVVLSLKA